VKCEDPPPPPPPGVVAAPPPPPDSIEAAAKEASGIPNPGRYEEAATDGKRLVTLDTFDGLRFDINKQLSPYMAVVHSFWLGTSMIPDGRNKTYTFITQVADESGMFFTRVDFDRGAVDGRVHRALLGGIAMGKLQLGVSKDGQQDQCLAELDFGGQTWTGNLKYGSMAQGIIFGMNYLQSITPRLAMGGEGMYVASNQSLMSNYTLKYTMPASSGENNVSDGSRPSSSAVAPDSPSSSMCVNFNAGMGALTMNYKRIVTPNRVTLGAELQCSPFDLSQSQVLVGGEFKLTRSKISLCVDGGGRIQSLVEAKLGTGGAPTIQFSGELDHYSNVMRFGYGLNIDA
jgi:mitochondrial import receptor subunit TOM40